MNKLEKDIKLTEDCIEHWIRVRDQGESSSGKNCALCVEYGDLGVYTPKEDTTACKGCPIRDDSGLHCDGTPYYHYNDIHRADDMLKYLRGLLLKLVNKLVQETNQKLKRDIKLTEECILHWYRVGAGIDKPTGDLCSLCKEYFYDYCDRCPIKEDTGKKGCNDTPFRMYVEDRPIHMLVYLNDLRKKLQVTLEEEE